jgi:hypothetical protein
VLIGDAQYTPVQAEQVATELMALARVSPGPA